MPTVIVLDVSLSMTRICTNITNTNKDAPQYSYHALAVEGIHQFLDYLSANSRLEHVSLVSPSRIITGVFHKLI